MTPGAIFVEDEMRTKLTAEQWARVRRYVQVRSRVELDKNANLARTLSGVADAISTLSQSRTHELDPSLVTEALKWARKT